jgi:hypothetical protein
MQHAHFCSTLLLNMLPFSRPKLATQTFIIFVASVQKGVTEQRQLMHSYCEDQHYYAVCFVLFNFAEVTAI